MSEHGDPQESFEQMVNLARGPKGDKGAQGEQGTRGQRGLSQLQGRAIVVLFLLAALFGAGNLFWTAHEVNSSASAQHRDQVAQQAAQAAAAAKAAIPVCMALLHLSRVQGSHGDSGATYGQNLQAAFRQVYAATDCPKIMAK